MSFEPRNLFITGGAGFIGANFVRHWLGRAREGRVVVFDALTYAGNIDNLAGLDEDPRYVFVKGDICDEAAVRALPLREQAWHRHRGAFCGGVACRPVDLGSR